MEVYLFDFDGTLVDSMPTFIASALRVLDDNINAIQTGKRAGVRVYGVYDDSSKAYGKEMKAVAERYIVDFIELLEKE